VRRTVACLTAVASLSLVTLGLVQGAALAAAPSATIKFVKYGRLQEDGSVLVSVAYECQPGVSEGGLSLIDVYLVQQDQGSAQTAAKCDDRKHKVTLDVVPRFLEPFEKGTATATASVHNNGYSSTAETQAELKVR
jgi:acyl-coenzyme A thioesterase PaaI-like protein